MGDFFFSFFLLGKMSEPWGYSRVSRTSSKEKRVPFHTPQPSRQSVQTTPTRTRSNTAYSPLPSLHRQSGQRVSYKEEQNRSRSSSWPIKPVNVDNNPPRNTRPTKRKNSDPATPQRKKRKRLNPQRR